jgi:flagellar hook assembly protein FlgD
LTSLGVFEHWNNATDRLYSRNLGTGDGIELKYIKNGVSSISSGKIENINIAAPNPFSNYTRFIRPANVSKNSKLEIYNLSGQVINSFSFANSDVIEWNGNNDKNSLMPNGMYLYKILDHSSQTMFSGKVILKK